MKRLLFAMFALSMLFSHGQSVMVVYEAETKSVPTFEKVMHQWMGAVKTVMNMEDARMRVFREQGTRKMQMVQWFDSLSEMAKHIEDQDANQDKIGQSLQSMDPMPDGTWEKFTESTNFNEAAVWKYRPDLSTTPQTFSPLSQEEKDKITYRRVQYMSVGVGQDDAFENWRKKVNTLDKDLGISFHMAVFENVFGARGSNYMIILLDTSRFDYHKHWEERMKKRQANEAWTKFMESADNMSKWSVVREANWNQIVSLTF
ncbi:MAG: hypothetical protein KJN68_02570 [Bacteroidia bacterium]|nr:hypothetical protein [Bacteroidia bacterium]